MSSAKMQISFAPKSATSTELAPKEVDLAPVPEPDDSDDLADYRIELLAFSEPVRFAQAKAAGVCPICWRIGCPWLHSHQARAMGF